MAHKQVAGQRAADIENVGSITNPGPGATNWHEGIVQPTGKQTHMRALYLLDNAAGTASLRDLFQRALSAHLPYLDNRIKLNAAGKSLGGNFTQILSLLNGRDPGMRQERVKSPIMAFAIRDQAKAQAMAWATARFRDESNSARTRAEAESKKRLQAESDKLRACQKEFDQAKKTREAQMNEMRDRANKDACELRKEMQRRSHFP